MGTPKIYERDVATKIKYEAIARAYVAGGCSNRGLREVCDEVGYQLRAPHDLIRNGYFQSLVRQILTEQFEQLELSPRRVLEETAAIAFGKISDVYDEHGDLIEPYLLPAHVAAMISSLEIETRTVVDKRRTASTKTNEEHLAEGVDTDEELTRITTKKYKFHDKNAALNTLARHFKIVGGVDEGVNALAAALAERLKSARTRLPNNHVEPIEEANIILKAKPRPESNHEIW